MRKLRCWLSTNVSFSELFPLDNLPSKPAYEISQVQYHEINLLSNAISRQSRAVLQKQDIFPILVHTSDNALVKQTSSAKAIPAQLIDRRLGHTSTFVQARRVAHFQIAYSSWLFGSFSYLAIAFQHQDTDRAMNESAVAEDNPIEYQKTIIFSLPFWRRGLAISTSSKYGFWTRTLRISPVIPQDSLIFDLCETGDVQMIQKLFRKGLASPFDITEGGHTLLHVGPIDESFYVAC